MEVKIIGYQSGRSKQWNDQLEAAKPTGPLPPEDPEGGDEWSPTNEHRAGWAGLALKTFNLATGSDLEDAVADMIADLAHWCDRHGLKLADEIDRARGMYGEETEGKGAQFEE